MKKQSVKWDDTFMTHPRGTSREAQVARVCRLLMLLRASAGAKQIRDELFPGRELSLARDLAVRAADEGVFEDAIKKTWGAAVAESALPVWNQWRARQATSHERLRALRRLIRLIDDIARFFPQEAS